MLAFDTITVFVVIRSPACLPTRYELPPSPQLSSPFSQHRQGRRKWSQLPALLLRWLGNREVPRVFGAFRSLRQHWGRTPGRGAKRGQAGCLQDLDEVGGLVKDEGIGSHWVQWGPYLSGPGDPPVSSFTNPKLRPPGAKSSLSLQL